MDSKRIAIARAIMYKELAKRQEARVIECKRRGLWALWQHQTKYKTLWHFLRASNDRLIMLCDELMFDISNNCKGYVIKMKYFSRCYDKNLCKENKNNIAYYNNLYSKDVRVFCELKEIRNKITGGKNNEN